VSQIPAVNNYLSSDEIDLVVLFQSLWAQKVLIALFACVATTGAAAYAFLAPPQYEVQSFLRLASTKDLDELNRTGVYNLKPSVGAQASRGITGLLSNPAKFFSRQTLNSWNLNSSPIAAFSKPLMSLIRTP
jgi:chain length determinant protein (polysaccharide antigen chain regulator)